MDFKYMHALRLAQDTRPGKKRKATSKQYNGLITSLASLCVTHKHKLALRWHHHTRTKIRNNLLGQLPC